MASYPTAVVSFTTKNNGDTIQPSHINDPQSEIVAIEDGILNGTARLNSSNSTIANLSVTGGSTFGSTITIPSLPRCALTAGNVQGISNATWTGVNFDTENENVGSMHSTSVNSSRVTFASTGFYVLSASISYASNSSGQRGLRFVKNDSLPLPGGVFTAAVNGDITAMPLTIMNRITTSGDYITVQAFQNTGGALNVGNNSTSFQWQSMLSVVRVPGL